MERIAVGPRIEGPEAHNTHDVTGNGHVRLHLTLFVTTIELTKIPERHADP